MSGKWTRSSADHLQNFTLQTEIKMKDPASQYIIFEKMATSNFLPWTVGQPYVGTEEPTRLITQGPSTLQAGPGPVFHSGWAGCWFLHLHLPSGPDFNQKSHIITTSNMSSVCFTSRPKLWAPDTNDIQWHVGCAQPYSGAKPNATYNVTSVPEMAKLNGVSLSSAQKFLRV